MEQLEIRTRRHGDVEVLVLGGWLVLGPQVTQLDTTFDNLLSHGVNRFVLVVDGLKRLDSSGIGSLARVLQQTKQQGGWVRLVNPSRQVTMALKMCQLLPLFGVFEQEQDAISAP